ncbi:MAG: hypothetical protein ACI8QZ_001529 [Chlamydiales bacterium]|jgi:hypothetical protein
MTPLLLTVALGLLGHAQNTSTPDLAGGRALLRSGAFEDAEELLREIVDGDDSNDAAWMLLGQALRAQERFDEALEGFERASETQTLAGRAGFFAGCMYAQLGDFETARARIEKAVAAGFQDRPLLTQVPELEELRKDPRLLALIPPLLEGAAAFAEEPRILHTFIGEAPGDQFGWVARPVGDLDGDGVTDFASTSPTYAGGKGRVYVYSAKSGELLFTLDGRSGWNLGMSVAGEVDINGDGTPDVLAGAPAPAGAPGHAIVASGRDGSILFEVTASEMGDGFGTKVCGIQDLNGDGCDELVVSAMRADAEGQDSGRVYVYSGKDAGLMFQIDGPAAGDLFGSSADATHSGDHNLLIVGAMGTSGGGRALVYRCDEDGAELHFTIDPDETGTNLGQYFATVLGDVDGDGTPDLYASDWNNAAKGPATGRVYVHSGANGDRLLTITGQVAGEGFGTSAAVCGDVNGDGSADLAIGAWQHSSGAPSGGKVYLHSGKDGSLLSAWTSLQAGDTLGFDAVGLGDVDGDGAADYLLTSAWSAVRGPRTGRVFVVAGPRLE